MNKKIFKNIVRDTFSKMLLPFGFKMISDTLYTKLSQDRILYIVSFELGFEDFTCTVAMQPLYVFSYTDGLNLSMGTRITRFKSNDREWFSYSDYKEGLAYIEKKLISDVFPWFDNFGTPQGIIQFITAEYQEDYGFILFNIFTQNLYIGFSYLYLKDLNNAIKYLALYTSSINDNAAAFILDHNNKIKGIVASLEAGEEFIDLEKISLDTEASLYE